MDRDNTKEVLFSKQNFTISNFIRHVSISVIPDKTEPIIFKKKKMANIASANAMVSVRIPVTNITDLNTHCLLTVFEYLDVVDLANLLQANIVKKLGKRSRKKLLFDQNIVKAFKIKVKTNEWKTRVHANDRYAPEDIKMLRSFGREIESLLVDCTVSKSTEGTNRRYERALEDAIIDNCRKTLTDITFDDCNKDTMKELEQPFKSVQSVEFFDCHLGSTLGLLKKWFPKMVNLNFTYTYVFDAKIIHEHFTDLKLLTVWNNSQQDVKEGKMIFSNSDLEVFLQMNPQLQMLNIQHDGGNGIIVDSNLLTLISKNLGLTELKLNFEKYHFQNEWGSTVAVDNLTRLDIECTNCRCLSTIKITLPKLNELILQINYHRQIDYEAIASFVLRAAPKQLTILSKDQTLVVDNAQVIRMISLLPKLEELSIECKWDHSIPNAVLNLIVNCAGSALDKLIGAFYFGDPRPEYSQMREVFREQIIRNDLVTNNWVYRFNYRNDESDHQVDTIEFKKK